MIDSRKQESKAVTHRIERLFVAFMAGQMSPSQYVERIGYLLTV